MSKISTYEVVPIPKLADKLIGTSVGGEPEDLTYNFTLGELLNLFIPNIPANTLQGVLDYGNTATQNINLTGTVNTTNLAVSATATILNSNLTGQTRITGGLYDRLNSIGTAGQVLTSTGTKVEWYTIPTVIPTLQQVLASGNTADISIILTANVTAVTVTAASVVANTNLSVNGTLRDGLAAVGSANQLLSSTGSGVRWVDMPVYTAESPLSINSITRVISIQQAGSTQSGYLSSADWINFDGKQGAINITTVGSSGPSTLVGSTINVPNYTLAGLGGVPQSRTLTINGISYNLSEDRSWTIAAGVSSVSATTPLFSTGGVNPNISIQQSGVSLDGYLSSADWLTFNNKQAAGNYITSLTGQATAVGPGASVVTLDNTAVIGKVLTGLNVTGGTVTSTDNILAAFGKVQNQINGLIGGSIFQGTWNAATNTPTLVSGVGTNGYYYIVSVDGSTNLDGITDWKVGDWAIFAGTTWEKVDNTESVSSVNGYVGNVSLVTGDVFEGAGSLPGRPSQLYFTDARSRAAISLTTIGSSGASTYNSTTGVFNVPVYTDAFVGTVTSVAALTLGTSGTDLSSSVANSTTTPVITLNVPTASAVNRGALSSADWTTFNSKQNTITLTTTGTAGVSTLIGSTLNIPNYTTDLSGYVTLATDQTITGLKTILRGGDVLNFKIGTDTLYGLKVAYNQNELVPSGEATWSFVNTFNRDGSGFSVTPLSFFRGVLVTGERLLSASINANLLDYYGNNPSGRYPVYAYNTGVQQFSDSILVGYNTGLVNAITGVIASLPTGVVANFNGRVIGVDAVNANEFATLGQVTSTSRAAISLTTTGTSGPATYSSVTGVLNIPEYQGGVTSFNTRTGAVTLTSGDVTTALGYTPVTDLRTLTINGETYNLTANRSWTIGVNPSAREIQTYIATASQTTFTVTGGYTVGLVDVFINGVRLTSSDLTATNGTTVVLTVGTAVGNIVDIIKYTSGFTNAVSGSGTTNELAYFTGSTVIASLSTGTYPSLAELSYVKGVTSSIQTQLNGKQAAGTYVTSVTASSPLFSSGGTTPAISIPVATTSVNGYLSSTDWTTFNNKQGTITLTTTGTSGAATFSSNTLNIPNYGSALSGYLPLTGGTLTGALNGTSAAFTGAISGSANTITATTGIAGDFTNNSTTNETLRARNNGSGNIAAFRNASAEVASISNSGGLTLSGALGGTSATFSGIVTINTNVAGLVLNRNAVTNYNGISLQTAGVGKWFVGMRENLSSNNYVIYSEVGTDVLTLNQGTGAATFSSGIIANGYLIGAQSGTNNLLIDWSGSSQVTTLTNTELFFGTNAQRRVTITSAGSVGIGTASPGARLNIAGNLGAVVGAGGSAMRMTNTDTSNWSSISAGIVGVSNAGIELSVDGTSRMIISGGGNVGIGTANPLGLLTVTGNSSNTESGQIRIINTAQTLHIGYNTTFDYSYINSYKAGFGYKPISLNPDGGNVLIGTTTDIGIRLQVNGNAAFNGFGINNASLTSMGTSQNFVQFRNTGGDFYLGQEGSVAGAFFPGSSAYGNVFYGVTSYDFIIGGVRRFQIRSDSAIFAPGVYNFTTGSAANVVVFSDGSMQRSTSSIKYKKNVQDYRRGLDDVMKLRPVTYEGISKVDSNKTFAGLIAEEVHELGLNEFVQYAEDGSPDALAYQNMIALAFKAIQELKAELDELKGNN